MNQENSSNISDERARQFAVAYRKECDEEMDIREARIMTGRLLHLYRLVARPQPEKGKEPRPQ